MFKYPHSDIAHRYINARALHPAVHMQWIGALPERVDEFPERYWQIDDVAKGHLHPTKAPAEIRALVEFIDDMTARLNVAVGTRITHAHVLALSKGARPYMLAMLRDFPAAAFDPDLRDLACKMMEHIPMPEADPDAVAELLAIGRDCDEKIKGSRFRRKRKPLGHLTQEADEALRCMVSLVGELLPLAKRVSRDMMCTFWYAIKSSRTTH